jgi:hypothetical protein
MALRRFARVDVTDFLSVLEGTKKGVTQARQDLQMEAAKAGADRMREIIETKGTGETWSSPKRAKESRPRGFKRQGSFPGRVNTGNMRDSVGFRFESGEKKTISAFGWINNPTDSDKEYFEAQEYGFTAGGFRKEIEVLGMFALRDARLYVSEQVLPRLARKYEKRITRGNY